MKVRRQTLSPVRYAWTVLLWILLQATPFVACHAELQPSFIRGMALNAATGAAIANAAIATSSGVSSQTENGLFYLRVPPNVYDLIGSAPGFRSNMATGIFSGPGQVANVDIWLAPASTRAGTLRGRAVQAGSNSGGIAGALVFTDTGAIAFTDEDGYFTAVGPSGNLTVTIAATGFSSRIIKNVDLPVFGARSITARLNKSLDGLTGPVSGSIRDACTGQQLAGARISSSSGAFLQTTDGTYRLTAPPGNTSILVCLEGYECAFQTATLGIIPIGALLNFSLIPLQRGIGTVTGTVTDNMTAQPLVGARIETETKDITFSTAQGSYFLRASPCADQLMISREGYQTLTVALAIAAGATTEYNASMKPLTSCLVNGTVKNLLTGMPVDNARLQADSGELAQTDAAGTYSLSIPSCSSVISVCADGYFKARRIISSTNEAAILTRDIYMIPCPFCRCAAAESILP